MNTNLLGKDMKVIAAVYISSLIAAMTLSGCGSGFQSASSSPAALLQTTPGNGTSGVTPTPTPAAGSIQFSGSVSTGPFGNVQVVSIDTANQAIDLNLPLLPVPIFQGASFSLPITQLPGATIGLNTTSAGGTGISLAIPLKYLVNGASFLPTASTLPNGQPIPPVAAGVLPYVAVSLPQITTGVTATVYIGKTQVDLFVSSPYNPIIGITMPIHDPTGVQTLGYVSIIPNGATGTGAGFFISVSLPTSVQDAIDNLVGGG